MTILPCIGMAISSKPDEESDTQSEWRGVWRNILDPIKYSGNRVHRFLDLRMVMGLSISYLPRPEYPIKYIKYIDLFILKSPKGKNKK